MTPGLFNQMHDQGAGHTVEGGHHNGGGGAGQGGRLQLHLPPVQGRYRQNKAVIKVRRLVKNTD